MPDMGREVKYIIANIRMEDFRGDTINQQNIVAVKLGRSDLIQSSYFADLNPSYTNSAGSSINANPVWDRLDRSVSYSHGDKVNFVLWSQLKSSLDSDNRYNLSGKSTESSDILFGFGGDDKFNGGALNDYIYGGEDDDAFFGSEGSDLFHGGGTLKVGGSVLSIDDDGVDYAEYGGLGPAAHIEISTDVTLDSTHSSAMDAARRLLVLKKVTGSDGIVSSAGVDTLVSVEKIVGTNLVDTFFLTNFEANCPPSAPMAQI